VLACLAITALAVLWATQTPKPILRGDAALAAERPHGSPARGTAAQRRAEVTDPDSEPDPQHESDNKALDAQRVLGGIVRDAIGPIQEGWFEVSTSNEWSERVRLSADGNDGSFLVMIPKTVKSEAVMAQVWDQRRFLFVGTLAVREGHDIFVESSRTDPDPITGRIDLPGAWDDDRWRVQAIRQNGRRTQSFLFSPEPYSGQTSEVRLELSDLTVPQAADDEVIALLVTEVERPFDKYSPSQFFRRILGHRIYPDIEQLRLALHNGLILETRPRTLRPSGCDLALLETVKPIAISVDSGSLLYRADPQHSADEGWRFHLPDGDYWITAPRCADSKNRTARVRLDSSHADIRFDWQHETPGDHSVVVEMSDHDAEDGDVSLTFATANAEAVAIHSGVAKIPANEASVEIAGLLPVEYVLTAKSSSDDIGFEPVWFDAQKDDMVQLRPIDVGTVRFRLEGLRHLAGEQIDFSSIQAWWRRAPNGDWTRLSQSSGGARGFRVAGLPLGAEIEIAVRSDWWEGTASHVVERNAAELAISCRPLLRLAGEITPRDETSDCSVVWRGPSTVEPIWRSCHVTDATFEVLAPLDDLGTGELLVIRAGSVVGRATVDSNAPQAVRIHLR